MRPIWLVTGKRFGSRCLILGSGNDVAVLAVNDYLEALLDGVAWREAGVQYLEDPKPFNALMSESRFRTEMVRHPVATDSLHISTELWLSVLWLKLAFRPCNSQWTKLGRLHL
jgi:hypothetical protein